MMQLEINILCFIVILTLLEFLESNVMPGKKEVKQSEFSEFMSPT